MHFVNNKFLKLLIALTLVSLLIVGYNRTGKQVILLVNGHAFPLQTHQLSVERLLLQANIVPKAADILWPPLESGLKSGLEIKLELARPIEVDLEGNGIYKTILTHRQTPLEIYQEQGINITETDDIYLNGTLWNATTPIPISLVAAPTKRISLKQTVDNLRPLAVRLTLHKAMAIHLNDGGQTQTIFTTEQNVGDLLMLQNIPLYLGDTIRPDLSTPLHPDMEIIIERSVPVSLIVDGRIIKTRTRYPTVAQVLAQEEIALVGQDYTIPSEKSLVNANTNIEVIRVFEKLEIEKSTTAFETIWLPDPDLEIDRQHLQQEGQQGVTKTRIRVRYENGQEVSRVEEETWLDQEAADKIIAYGTKIIIRTVETPDGPMQYWRKVRMLATGYSAATSGKSRDHPAYGITRTGMKAGFGIVAVDPSVIPLLTWVYATGYGRAIAGDTGGLIKGRHIDLGYEDGQIPNWYTWIDVYQLTPVPPKHQIRYVLPQWPQER